VYGVTTYDALFKYVLSDDKIRPSFFHAFIPNLPIVSSERLDDHMNPLQSLQLLRTFLHSKDTESVVKNLTPVSSFEVGRRDPVTQNLGRDDKATVFLHEMVSRFDEIKRSFPRAKYDGTMDFVCQLENDGYALVEMQVVPENYWDRRALAYVAAFYGNQLFKGGEWKHIRKVIGINILGGGKESKAHWIDTPTQFVRHYKVQEQLHIPSQYIDGIELIQYSLMNAPKTLDNQERLDWVTFFKEGHYMSEEQVRQRIKTPEVLEAFKRARIKSLPAEVLATYEAEDKEYDRYSQHTQSLVLQGEVKAFMLLIKSGKITIEDIIQNGDISDEIKAELKKQL
jgi:predicted transposase/invertase (TIGR01784 family)